MFGFVFLNDSRCKCLCFSPDAKLCGFKFLKVQMCFDYVTRCKNVWLRVSQGASVYLLFPICKNVWLRVSQGASVFLLIPQMQKCVASSVSPAVETSCGTAADKVRVWKEFLITLSRPL